MKAVFVLIWWISPIYVISAKELWPLSRLQAASTPLAVVQRYFTVFLNFVWNDWLPVAEGHLNFLWQSRVCGGGDQDESRRGRAGAAPVPICLLKQS